MDEIQAIEAISNNLTHRKTVACFSNYEVLSNNIMFVDDLLSHSIESIEKIIAVAECLLADDDSVVPDAKSSTNGLYSFRSIVPRVVANGINVSRRFAVVCKSDSRVGITLENVSRLRKSFDDYCALATSARQFIDSLVTDAYQLLRLDAKAVNYHVLTSLSSFRKFATDSQWHSLTSSDLEHVLAEFDRLSLRQRRNSDFTQCDHGTFAEKVDFAFTNLNLSSAEDDSLREAVKNMFKFTSEAAHIGYVSTLFSTSYDQEVIFGDSIGPYLPSTENLSEMKYQLLETSTRLYASVYLPAIKLALLRLLAAGSATSLCDQLDQLSGKLISDLATRNNTYYFFICEHVISSEKTIELPCMCGTTRCWDAPHNPQELFCLGCGSEFRLMEMGGDPGYVFTSQGPIKVIGSKYPDLRDLPPNELADLMRRWQDAMQNGTSEIE